MLKTLLAAVAIVGLIAAALTSSRLAEGSGCTNCVVSEPFTLQPTTIVVACVTSGCELPTPLPSSRCQPRRLVHNFLLAGAGSVGNGCEASALSCFFLPVIVCRRRQQSVPPEVPFNARPSSGRLSIVIAALLLAPRGRERVS